ncbi:hypothetical protein BH24DEI2_BH24DEI2_28460 [soil metagenome]
MRLTLVLTLFLLSAASYAQQWTVQTVALQDYGEALATRDELRALEYDAYVDFGLYEGQQFVRVRIGCFEDQEGADFFARRLAGNVTAEAVAVPLETEPGTTACITRVVGFEPPAIWDVLTTTAYGITFWVEVLGQRRFIAFTGAGWRVAQSEQELANLGTLAPPSATSALSPNVFHQDAAARIVCDWRGAPVNIATGQLLWQGVNWAVGLEDGAGTA